MDKSICPGRSLSLLGSSQSLMNPDIAEAHQLRGWYDTVGHSLDYGEFRSEGGASAGGMGNFLYQWLCGGLVTPLC